MAVQTPIKKMRDQKFENSHFFFYRDRIEQEIAKSILSFGEKTKLRDACEYALTTGGNGFVH